MEILGYRLLNRDFTMPRDGWYASQVREPSRPTDDEKAVLWNAAFDQMIESIEAGTKARKARQAMRRELWKCGVTLAKNEACSPVFG
jgi:hypothetical protein